MELAKKKSKETKRSKERKKQTENDLNDARRDDMAQIRHTDQLN